jgi:hypothetical protein
VHAKRTKIAIKRNALKERLLTPMQLTAHQGRPAFPSPPCYAMLMLNEMETDIKYKDDELTNRQTGVKR